MACTNATMAKNRRVGRAGVSPHHIVFGCDDCLEGSNLDAFLEKPNDPALDMFQTNPQLRRSNQVREAALKKIIEMDHNEKWRNAARQYVPTEKDIYFPGAAVYYWKKQQAARQQAGRMARSPDRWHGPAIVIGREWDKTHAKNSYWIQHGTFLLLVHANHLNHIIYQYYDYPMFDHHQYFYITYNLQNLNILLPHHQKILQNYPMIN